MAVDSSDHSLSDSETRGIPVRCWLARFGRQTCRFDGFNRAELVFLRRIAADTHRTNGNVLAVQQQHTARRRNKPAV